jgi:hypothetical protein
MAWPDPFNADIGAIDADPRRASLQTIFQLALPRSTITRIATWTMATFMSEGEP